MHSTFRRKNGILTILETAIHTFVVFRAIQSDKLFLEFKEENHQRHEIPWTALSTFNSQPLPIRDLWKKSLPGRNSELFFKLLTLPPLAQWPPSARAYPASTIFCASLIRLLFNCAFKLLQMNLAGIQCWYRNRKKKKEEKFSWDKGVDENTFPQRLVKNKIIFFIDVSKKRSSSK